MFSVGLENLGGSRRVGDAIRRGESHLFSETGSSRVWPQAMGLRRGSDPQVYLLAETHSGYSDR